jgi:hypothetical protein
MIMKQKRRRISKLSHTIIDRAKIMHMDGHGKK